MKYELVYHDRFTHERRMQEFFAPSPEKAKEHADSMCERRKVPYCLVDANGRTWERDYSRETMTLYDWYEVNPHSPIRAAS